MSRRRTAVILTVIVTSVYLLLAGVYEIFTGQTVILPEIKETPLGTIEKPVSSLINLMKVAPSSQRLVGANIDAAGLPRAAVHVKGIHRSLEAIVSPETLRDKTVLRIGYESELNVDNEVAHTVKSKWPHNSGAIHGVSPRSLNIEEHTLSTQTSDIPRNVTNKGRLWPQTFPLENDDRIVNQLRNIPLVPSNVSSYKSILIYNNQGANIVSGGHMFRGCSVTKCVISKKLPLAETMDAILFQSGVPEHVPRSKPAGQIWILYLLESPLHTQRLYDYSGIINWTATYRRDSTLVTPYEKFVPYDNAHNISHKVNSNKSHQLTKTKKIAWFVSNCYTSNGRFEYVREMQKYISVDIYGECGPLKCPRGTNEDVCHQMLKRDYYFYLAFENSNCRDYVTEKFYHNALGNDVIPVVMGAAKQDYMRVAPPGSFIHVDDFHSPRHLAAYLDHLILNQTLYRNYFKWKGTGSFIDTKFWCRLCSMLHATQDHVTWYEDIESWWNGAEMCRTSRGAQKWATWTHNTRPSRHKAVT